MPLATTLKTDASVKADVLNELRWDATVDETEVGVQVHDGVVTLTGTISAYPKRLAARRAAHRVWGVMDVVDQMTVKIPVRWERTDEDIAHAVRTALKWDVLVPEERIKCTVCRGVVTLEGAVGNWQQRQDAEDIVHRLTGVSSVVNLLAVSGPTVEAATIKHEIEQALERQAEREAKHIDISVQGGTVTLRGTLRSWGEKNAIERVVRYTPGVRHLDDRTPVDPTH